nr:MAG TPA: hypothetical protein [Caudoviricetes sp.]
MMYKKGSYIIKDHSSPLSNKSYPINVNSLPI